MDQKIKSALEKINFADRYKTLSAQHQFDNGHFEKYETEKAKQTIEKFGYSTKYYKSENFFKILETYSSFQFQFNISLKVGATEFIWDILINNKRTQISGPWGLIARTILETDERIKLPGFRSYEELEEILKVAFDIYEDFKKAVILAYHS